MKRVNLLHVRVENEDNPVFLQFYESIADTIPKEFADRFHHGGSDCIWYFPLLENSPEYTAAMDLCQKYNLDFRVFQQVYYSKSEIEKVKFFLLGPSYPLELEGTNLQSYGTVYEGCCPSCGFGGVLTRDALVDRKFVRKYKIGFLEPEYFVSQEVKDLIEENGLTGVSFHHMLKDYKGRDMAPYYIMTIHHVLPPLRSSVMLIKEKPYIKDQCEHLAWHLYSDLHYEKEKLDGALDFNLTEEFINNERSRYPIISAKARKLFQKAKIYARYEPIALY